MVSLPFTDTVAAPAVVTPVLRVSEAGPAAGIAGGLAGAAAGLLGGSQATDPWSTHLLSLRMTLACGDHVDSVVLHLLESDQAPATALGDTLEIALGYGDESPTPLFSGSIEHLETTIAGYRRLVLASPALKLAHKRLNTSFEEQSAGDILRSLLDSAGVEAGAIDRGQQYPFYAVSDHRSLLAHVDTLSRQQGWLCYCGADGQLNCREVGPGTAASTLAYGVDLTELRHWSRPPDATGFRVIGSGAASSQGAGTWHWLTKEPKTFAESGDAAITRPERSLRDTAAARARADALAAEVNRQTRRVCLQTAAAPDIVAGSLFDISGAPDSSANGTYVADRVVMTYAPLEGFLSQVEGFRRDSAGSPLSAAGGLL